VRVVKCIDFVILIIVFSGVDSNVVLDGRCNSKFDLIFHSIFFLSKPSKTNKKLQPVDQYLEVKIHLSHVKCTQYFIPSKYTVRQER